MSEHELMMFAIAKIKKGKKGRQMKEMNNEIIWTDMQEEIQTGGVTY